MPAKKFVFGVSLSSGIVTGMEFAQITSDDLPGLTMEIGNDVVGANADGSILFVDGNGDLANAPAGEFLYDTDGSLGELTTPKTLYIGDRLGGTYPAYIALWDKDNSAWVRMSAANGLFTFEDGMQVNAAIGVYEVVISGGIATAVRLIVSADGSQSADLIRINGASSAVVSRFNKGGYFMTRLTSAPADGDLATGEAAIWFDSTAGAAKLMIKAKNASGTVVTGSVTLT